MSRYFDKLPLLDGFYLVRKFLASQNQPKNLPNANIALVDNSILTQVMSMCFLSIFFFQITLSKLYADSILIFERIWIKFG